jgi:hypothetical protein
MVEMEKPVEKLKRRERAWFRGKAADDAIRAIWDAAEKIGGEEERYLKVLLLTGKRPWGRENGNGLGALHWEHISPDWFWDAPPSKSKTKRLHPIPLAPLTQRVLHPRGRDGYVFDDIDAGGLMKRVRVITGLDDFLLHGIRHIVETKLETLKLAEDGRYVDGRGARGKLVALPHIRDMLFDHAPNRGTGAVYAHATPRDYFEDMLAAAEDWAEYVEGLTTGQQGVARLR